ncbi:MAG: hypothetical protein ABL907_26365 [Hyphomicrobium sp.]
MTHTATAAVARYRKAAKRITFDGSDKQEIYDLLGQAEALITELDAQLGMLAVPSKNAEVREAGFQVKSRARVRHGQTQIIQP